MAVVMDELVPKVQKGLSRSRTLSARTGSYIMAYLGVDDVLDWIKHGGVGQLEEYELERFFAGSFTPDLEDCIALESALPPEGLTGEEIEELVRQVMATGPKCRLMFGGRYASLAVPQVVVARYVRLMHPGVALDREILEDLGRVVTVSQERKRIRAMLRHATWQVAEHRALLRAILSHVRQTKQTFDSGQMMFLDGFVFTNRPKSLEQLVVALNNLMESYRLDQEHPVYNQRLEEYQGNSIRSRSCDEQVKAWRLAMARTWLDLLSPAGC
jgi:hypothetical protein